MTAPVIADCTGLWRRSLLVDADGSRDTGTGVVWLQGVTAYVDSRGFAGRLHQSGNVFEWHRDVDLAPPGSLPDEGRMHWERGTLVETGVHENYVEHWVREEAQAGPCWGLFLTAHEFGDGLLVYVGESFGWAGGDSVVVGSVGGPQWNALAIEMSENHVQANGVRWTVNRSEGM
jgi:hypothetical protein